MKNNFFKKGLLPLNIQLFAESDGETSKQEETNADNNIDYKALYEKVKAEKDKASKEASDYKKQLREKETDEEAKQRERDESAKEFQEKLDRLERENRVYKLKSEISKGGFLNDKDIENLVNSRFEQDDIAFAKTLNSVLTNVVKAKEEELKKEFKRDGRVGVTNNGGNATEDNNMTIMAKRLGEQSRRKI